MRRRLAFLLVGATILAACGGGATPSPQPSASATPAPTDIYSQTPVPSEAATLVPDVSPEASPPDASAEPSVPAGGTTYTVKAGDYMINIAKKFGITLAALKAANPTVEPTKMRVGSVLIIPPK